LPHPVEAVEADNVPFGSVVGITIVSVTLSKVKPISLILLT